MLIDLWQMEYLFVMSQVNYDSAIRIQVRLPPPSLQLLSHPKEWGQVKVKVKVTGFFMQWHFWHLVLRSGVLL